MQTTTRLYDRMSGPLNPNAARGKDQQVYWMRRYRAKRLSAPLRMARGRYLRHWTIHRAWQLWQRQVQHSRRDELMRLYQSMHSTAEELRRTSGPGTRPAGSLYADATDKKDVWKYNTVPIEYARTQTETPPVEPWDHDWKAVDAPGRD